MLQIGSVYTCISLPACFKITPKSNEMQETTWKVYSDFCQALKYPSKNLSSIDHMSDLFLYCHQQNLPLKTAIGGKQGKTLANKHQPERNNIRESEHWWTFVPYCQPLFVRANQVCDKQSMKMISTFDRSRIQPPAGEATLQLHCAMLWLVWVCWHRNAHPAMLHWCTELPSVQLCRIFWIWF